jgi:hypothetical protein
VACELWKDAVGNSRHGYEAYEQLAIYYERYARNAEQAREIVRQALDELGRAIRRATSLRGPIARSRRDSIIEWRGLNERPKDRFWMAW